MLTGGGYELEAHYPQWRRIHQPIERRQQFHDSLIKMMEGTILILQKIMSSITTIYVIKEQIVPLRKEAYVLILHMY